MNFTYPLNSNICHYYFKGFSWVKDKFETSGLFFFFFFLQIKGKKLDNIFFNHFLALGQIYFHFLSDSKQRLLFLQGFFLKNGFNNCV